MTKINPYASTATENNTPVVLPRRYNLNAFVVAVNALGGIAMSGGIFGAGALLIAVLRSGRGDTTQLAFVLLAGVVGMIWAAVFGVPVVVVGILIRRWISADLDWTPASLRTAAAVWGMLAGFISCVLPGVLLNQPLAVLLAFLAAAVGAAGCLAFMEPLVWRVRRERAINKAPVNTPALGRSSRL